MNSPTHEVCFTFTFKSKVGQYLGDSKMADSLGNRRSCSYNVTSMHLQVCKKVKSELKAALKPHMQVTLTSMMTEVSCLQNLQWLQAAAQASERPDQPVWCRAGSGSCSAGWSAEVPGRFCCRRLVSLEGFLGSHLQQFLVSASLSVLTAYSLGCDTH